MNYKIERFAQTMQIELEHNLHKGNIFEWKGLKDKIADLSYHNAKMLLALRMGEKQALKEYIADCANILMAIGDEVGLYDEEIKDNNKASELQGPIFKYVNTTEQTRGNLSSAIINKT